MEQNNKKEFFRSFREQAKAIITIDDSLIKFKKDEILISFKNNADAKLRISSVSGGYKKGDFGIYSGFSIEKGTVINIINNSDSKIKFQTSKLASETSYTFLKNRNRQNYDILENTNIATICQEIAMDMQLYYVPVIKSLVNEFKFAIDNFEKLEYYKFISKNRFSVGVTLAILANREDFIDNLIQMSTISCQIKNYDRRIIAKMKNRAFYFKKSKKNKDRIEINRNDPYKCNCLNSI